MANNAEVEAIFFRVLDDLEDYLGDLTLVGGWLSYVYPKFVWDNLNVNPVTTVDVDFGAWIGCIRSSCLRKGKSVLILSAGRISLACPNEVLFLGL